MEDQRGSLIRRLELLHELSFELSAAVDPDDVCRMAVERGRVYVDSDRISLWFLDPDDPDWFIGSFGIDEHGAVRDERASRVERDLGIYDSQFFQRRVPYRRWTQTPNFDHAHNVVGSGELVIAPIWNGTDSIGALCADNHLTGREFEEDTCQLLVLLARMVGHLVTIKRNEQRLRTYASELEKLATVDGLTGLYNRRTGMRFLRQQVSTSHRTGRHLAICYLDLNGLKAINDRFGHNRGDAFIREVAALLDRSKRESDVVCRMGGDEFLLVLPNCTSTEAAGIMDRLDRTAGEHDALKGISAAPWYSYGIAEFDPNDYPGRQADYSAVIEKLIHHADQQMYARKRSDRAE